MMYNTYNMGLGMVLALDAADADKAVTPALLLITAVNSVFVTLPVSIPSRMAWRFVPLHHKYSSVSDPFLLRRGVLRSEGT